MATKVTLTPVSAGYGSTTTINDNFTALADALDLVVWRDGTAPNSWTAEQDANSQRLQNLPDPVADQEPVTKGYGDTNYGGAAATAAAASAAAAATSEANAATSETNADADATSAAASAAAAAASAAAAEGVPAKGIGTIQNPILHAPLKNSLSLPIGVGSITFARSTTATYVDYYGVVQSAAVDEPRFEKDGLLIEDDSTNVCLRSEEFNNAAWTKTNATTTTNSIAAPDGNTTAETLTDDATSGEHRVHQAVTISAGVTTASCWIKKGTQDKASIRLYNATDLTFANVTFNLTAGTINSTLQGSGTIEAFPNDWYRCTVTGTATVANSSIYINILDDTYTLSYSGASETIYIWGAQVELLGFATSYIPTTTASVARTGDICSVTLSGNMPDISTTDFSLLVDVKLLSSNSQPLIRGIISAGESGGDIQYNLLRINNADTSVQYYRSGTSYIVASSLSTDTVRYGVTVDVSTDTVTGYVDGVSATPAVRSLATPGGALPTYIKLGCASGDNLQLNGHISNFRIYNEELSSELMRVA